MSIRAVSWALERQITNSGAKLVLIALADNADSDTGEAFPSMATLARKASMCVRSVRRHLRSLEADGFITCQYRVSPTTGRSTSSRYRLLLGDGEPGVRSPVRKGDPNGGDSAQDRADTDSKSDAAEDADKLSARTSVSPSPGQDCPPHYVEPSDLTVTELQPPRARGSSWNRERLDALETALREAAGLENDPNPSLMVVGEICDLIDAGVELERDILPIIRARAKRMKQPARSWTYFVDAIREAKEKRSAQRGDTSERNSRRNAAGPRLDVTEATWLARLGAGRKLKKWPRAEWGPAPGEAECACPEGLLEAGDGDGWANRSLV